MAIQIFFWFVKPGMGKRINGNDIFDLDNIVDTDEDDDFLNDIVDGKYTFKSHKCRSLITR